MDADAALEQDRALQVSPVRAIAIGGLAGFRIDVCLRPGWTKPCPWGEVTAIALTGVPPVSRNVSHNVTPSPMVMRLYLLAYKRGTLGVEVDAVNGSARLAQYDRVVRSFVFHAS